MSESESVSESESESVSESESESVSEFRIARSLDYWV